MSTEREAPGACRNCYWLLSGCEPPEEACVCTWFTPAGFDDEGEYELEQELEYGTEESEDRWSDGYEIFESAEAMVRYFKRE